MGPECEVLAPDELRREIAAEMKATGALYKYIIYVIYVCNYIMYKRDRGQPRAWARPDLEANLCYRSQTR